MLLTAADWINTFATPVFRINNETCNLPTYTAANCYLFFIWRIRNAQHLINVIGTTNQLT